MSEERKLEYDVLRFLATLWREFVEFLERRPRYTLHLRTGESVNDSNYQLNEGDSVVITLTITDDQTGATVTADPGSVTAVTTESSDTVVVDPSGTFVTLTAGSTASTGQLLTVNATVGGAAVGPTGGAVFTYDVVVVTPPTPTYTLTLSAGAETAPAAPAPTAPVVGTEIGQVNPTTGQLNT